MRNLFLASLFLTLACEGQDFSIKSTSCSGSVNETYDKREELQSIMDRYAQKGVPGISIGIRKGSQRWEGASGYASIEQGITLQPCHLMYSQSLAKVYTGVTTFQLYEEELLDLNASISKYLPSTVASKLKDSNKITIHMLLNHTSGVYDYAYSYAYVTYLLNNGDRVFSRDLLLDFILNGKPAFKPGEKYQYSNSNYFLLAYIAEYLTGKSHAELIREKILEPLQLSNTYYREEISQVVNTELVNSYFDRFSDGIVENVSKQQVNNVLSMMGDDSIIATPSDYVDFLDGLLNAKLFSPGSLELMKEWVKNSKGELAYGLGLDYSIFEGEVGYGHSGGGLGAGCALYFFPKHDLTLFIGVNLNTLIGSPIVSSVEEMRKEILEVVYSE